MSESAGEHEPQRAALRWGADAPSASGEATAQIDELLARATAGEVGATQQMLPLVYEHLRELARIKLAREPHGQTLQPTALVHEAYLKLVRAERPWNDRKHFFAAAALAMRRILVDRARAKRGEKRGGAVRRVTLQEWDTPAGASEATDAMDWLALDDAMAALEAKDSELAQIVHLRFFSGLTLEETALAMGTSTRTINRDWMVARAWLVRFMREAEA